MHMNVTRYVPSNLMDPDNRHVQFVREFASVVSVLQVLSPHAPFLIHFFI